MRNISHLLHLLTIGLTALLPLSVHGARPATVLENRALVYHGKIVRPDGSTPTGSMSVIIKILSPEPSHCVLWSETQTLLLDNGGFSAEIGHAVNRDGGAALNFKQVFLNNSNHTFGSATCDVGTSYTPVATDDRILTATFTDPASAVAITVEGLPIKSVPFALQAEEIGGYGLANLAKISGVGSSVTYTPGEVQTLKDMLGGDLYFDMKSRVVKNLGAPTDPTDAVSKSWVESRISSSGGGTVLNVSGTPPIAVANGSSSPTISIPAATNAVDGYLTATDRTSFAAKLSAVLGHSLASGQVWIGNGSNQATVSYLDIGSVKNSSGVAQFPLNCTAAQTLTWSSISDTMTCTNISALNASAITGGTINTARLGSGTANATTYLRGDGTWATVAGGGGGSDNLGDHAATQNLRLGSNWVSGDGDNEGLQINTAGNVGVGTASPLARLTVQGTAHGRTNVIATGATVNLLLSNNHLLKAPGGSTITLQNPIDGGFYTLLVSDTTPRTYTFTGCSNTYFSPANGTTSGQTTYTIMSVVDGSDTNCYVVWVTGFN